MKIYTRLVINMLNGEVLDEDSFDYTGPLEECISLGGGSEKSSYKPEPVNVWNPEQKAMGKTLAQAIQEGYASQVPRYPGQLYVPMTDLERQYLYGGTDTFAQDLAKYRTLGEQTWQSSLAKAGTPSFIPNAETTEQYYQDFIRTPYMKEFEEVYEPGIRELYAGPSFHSSARVEAQREGYEDLSTTLGAKRAELYYQDELARRGALESAAQREAQLGALTPEMTAALSQSTYMGQEYLDQLAKDRADLSRGIEQERLMADFQRWLMGEQVAGVTPTQYDPYTQLMFQYLGLQPIVVGSSGQSSGWSAGGSFKV